VKTQCTQKCEPEKEGAAGEEKAGNNGNWVNEVAGEEGIGGSGDCVVAASLTEYFWSR